MKKLKISETAFASQVEDLLRLYHWHWCHFRPGRTTKGWRTSLTGHKGLPDYIAVRPPRLVFAELKDEYSKTTPEQQAWLDLLDECQKAIITNPMEVRGEVATLMLGKEVWTLIIPEVYLWRPSQFDEVRRILG